MSDKDFWIIVRRALMMIVRVIERKYIGGGETEPLDTGGDVSLSYLEGD